MSPATRGPAKRRPAPSPATPPSLRLERQLLRSGHTLVAGMDEVGRGALAGPVSVGVLVVDEATRTAPTGLRDSKLLTPATRDALAPKVRRWALAWAVGHTEPAEIDAIGIIAALRLAGRRALAQLPVRPDVVILDGNHDYLSDPREPSLLDELGELGEAGSGPALRRAGRDDPHQGGHVLRGRGRGERAGQDDPGRDDGRAPHGVPAVRMGRQQGLQRPDHLQALAEHGSCEQHRRSWRLPGLAVPAPRVVEASAEALDLGLLEDEALADLTSHTSGGRKA